MTDPSDKRDFAAALREALDSVRGLRGEAERLSASLESERPATIRTTSRSFESSAESARSVFERLLGVLRDANHHTLESAYHALVEAPGREEEAARMQELIHEYKRTRAIISKSERQISDALLEITDQRRGEDPEDDSSGLHAEA